MNLQPSCEGVTPLLRDSEEEEEVAEEGVRGDRIEGSVRRLFFLFLDFLVDFPEDFLFLVCIVSFTRVRGRLY